MYVNYSFHGTQEYPCCQKSFSGQTRQVLNSILKTEILAIVEDLEASITKVIREWKVHGDLADNFLKVADPLQTI